MLSIQSEQVLPSQIKHRSLELIQQELDRMEIRLDSENELVVKRAIHTTANFKYAGSLVFSSHAVRKGTEALRQGTVIITDTNMRESGIDKRTASALGAEVLRFMANEDTAGEAEGGKCTRAVASMEKAVRLFGAPEDIRFYIFTTGSASIALIRPHELIKEGRIKPPLVIGAPVGFVNMAQSKGLVLTLGDTLCIVAGGGKGDSNVAAAIYNALLYQIK